MSSGRGAVNAHRRSCARSLCTAHCSLPTAHFPRGMTLIELLITMTIMAIISAAILGTASAAFENARRSRTQSLITKISGLVLERWDSYANRRVEINPSIEMQIDTWANAANLTPLERSQRSATRGQMMADARLLALRELMMMEMPDSWADVNHTPLILANVPALTQGYQRFYVNGHEDEREPAECLYMTVMYATGDGEARTLFSSQDIGDTDGDGALEFIDGWGRAIGWCRWPAGVVSDLQPVGPDGRRVVDDHDPFDIFRRDAPDLPNNPPKPNPELYPIVLQEPIRIMRARNTSSLTAPAGPPYQNAFRMVPLIFSAGPDGGPGRRFFDIVSMPLDPYAVDGDGLQNGEIDPSSEFTSKDDITNHLIQY